MNPSEEAAMHRVINVGLLAAVVLSGCGVAARPAPRPVRSLTEDSQARFGLGTYATSASGVAQASHEEAAEPRPLALLGVKPVPQNDQEAAAEALARIGAPAAPSLVMALRNRDPAVRREAAKVLARMGPEARDAAGDLTLLLDDPEPTVRLAAAHALGQIGPGAAGAVPALMRNLVQGEAQPPGGGNFPPREVAPAGFQTEAPPAPAVFGRPTVVAPPPPEGNAAPSFYRPQQ